jgi:UDP-N-acetylglucosamine 4-epimerase
MNIVVTGAAGFIGHHVVEELLKRKYRVCAIDNFSTGKESNVEKFFSNPNFNLYRQDLCYCNIGHPHAVIHLAAMGSVPKSMSMPLTYYYNNVTAFDKMLQDCPAKRIVYASSSSVYGDIKDPIKKESMDLGKPLSPYAETKQINERQARMAFAQYKTETIGLRFFNVFGPEQNPNGDYAAVIPRWIKSIKENGLVTRYGDGTQTRDFCYIKNVVDAIMLALETDNEFCFGKVFNVGYGKATSLNDLALLLEELMGKSVSFNALPEREGDVKHSMADIVMAKNLLKYYPKYDLRSGLEEMLNGART